MTIPYLFPASFVTDNDDLNMRWNCCGMIMDWIPGGCYRRRAVVFDDRGEVDLIWYPAPKGALPFPFPHAFGSRLSCPNNEPEAALGERDVPRIWTPARMLLYSGQTFCGRPEWWLQGVPRSIMSLPPPDCKACKARLGLVGQVERLSVRRAAVAGGDFNCDFALAFRRFCVT